MLRRTAAAPVARQRLLLSSPTCLSTPWLPAEGHQVRLQAPEGKKVGHFIELLQTSFPRQTACIHTSNSSSATDPYTQGQQA